MLATPWEHPRRLEKKHRVLEISFPGESLFFLDTAYHSIVANFLEVHRRSAILTGHTLPSSFDSVDRSPCLLHLDEMQMSHGALHNNANTSISYHFSFPLVGIFLAVCHLYTLCLYRTKCCFRHLAVLVLLHISTFSIALAFASNFSFVRFSRIASISRKIKIFSIKIK